MHTAATADVLRKQPGLLGDASRPGLQALPRLVTDAEAALQAGQLQLAQSCLETYFAETSRPKEVKAGTVADHFVIRAHFAAGQLVSKLSSSFKGRKLVDAVLEAVGSIMRGVELAAANPRYSHLVYNGSVHFWHAARPLQCDKLRSHLLPSQGKLCQALEKVDGQQAWRVRHLLSLALCQGSEDGKPEDMPKTLAKALELATAANLQPLRAEVLALQTHHQTQQAAKAAAAKPGGPAGSGGKGPGVPAAPPAPKQAAPPGKRKPGEPAAVGAGKADVDGALALLQWVLSAKPDAAAAEQQLQAALKLVDLKPDKPVTDAHLGVVARIGWAAAVCGASSLAEQCTCRAASSQDLGPRLWADLTRLLLSLKAAPEAALGPGSDSSGSGAALNAAALRARREVLEGVDEAASAFLKLADVEGIHNAAVLAWNAGLPLLQPCHRSLVKPAFTAIGKALEAVGSPWARLRAALHLEVAKAEADSDSFIKAAKEVSTALSLNYPSSADMAAVCGYERPLDRYLEPMGRAAQLRGVAPVNLGSSAEAAVHPDDDVVLLLERAKDSKSAPLRSEYLQKAVNKLALLQGVLPPNGPASTEALQSQLRAARTQTQLWADVVELAWRPCQLDVIVRSAVPFVLEPDWQPCGDKEMLVLQARVALVGADAAQAALSKLDAELAPPPGYAASRTTSGNTSSTPSDSTGHTATGTDGSQGRAGTASQRRGDHAQDASLAQGLQRHVADYLLQGMRLSVAAGGRAWLAVNASMAAWSAYLPLMQKERYADLASLLLPMLQVLLQEPSNPQHTQLVILAEAAAKAAEHVTLLECLRLQQQQQQQQQQGSTQQQSDAGRFQQAAMPSALPWYKPLAEARAATAGQDLAGLLAGAADVLELLSATAAACQTALTRAATASELQGLIQSYARLQQLQGKPVAVPPGAPAAMADTSKVLGLIEGLTATAPSAGSLTAIPPAAGAAAGRAVSAASAAGATRGTAAGGKGAPAVPAMSKAEQDVRATMALLAAMPTVNLQLWSQLSQAAGCHDCWLLARECASAALGALPADRRDLSAVAAASEVPELGAQGWYHLSVAEMQQGQAVLSLLLSADNSAAATNLSLRHSALQHFATATNLASFIRRADLAEAAARLAYNTVTAPGGLLETPLTRAVAVKALTTVTNALNATRPADISFQVQVNLLLAECLSAAGRWQEARRHIEALHRSLPLSKQKGPGAAAALEAIAGWRATSLVKAPPGTTGLQDMPRLLSELSTPKAKARAWLAFAQATPCPAEQLQARQAALAALDTLAPAAKVEYQLEFAGWLAGTASHLEADTQDAEQLLLDAAAALDSLPLFGSACGARSTSSTASGPRRAPSTADSGSVAAAGTAGRKTRATVDGWGASSGVSGGRRLEQLIRVHMLLSQVAAGAESRQHHLLQAQAHAEQLLTGSLLAAGAEAPPQAPQDAALDAVAGIATDSVPATSSCGDAAPVSGSAGAVPGIDAAAKQQPPVPALPLPFLTRPGTAASAATATARSAAYTSRGLAQTVQLPGCPLDYATWEPDAAIVARMQELAAAACASSSSSGSQGVASGVGDVVLSRSSMQAPELLLANLRLLSEQLQAAGRQIEALPVLQLAHLVALVTLGSDVAAAAVALDLSCVCEQLVLPAAAAGWLQLAALERWPSHEQLQQAEVSKSMQQMSKGVLQAYYRRHSGRSAQLAADSQESGCSSIGFLHEALDDVEPATLQSWLRGSCDNSSSSSHPAAAGSTVHSTWGSRAGSALGRSRPASAAVGTRAAVAALTAGVQDSLLHGRVRVLQVAPLKPLDSWVSIARYLVEHAQYTAGQGLCGVMLELARSSGDVAHEAEVLLLQARLALLAQHNEDAVKLSQAAQELGGSVQLWRDSVLCYAAARRRMADRGPADALEALENGAALVGTVARGHGHCFSPTLLEASTRLKMCLATELESRSLQQLAESQSDTSCLQAAARLHGRAVAVCKEAAVDAQQAGAVLLQGQALQQAVRLLAGEQGAAIAERQQHLPGQRGSRSGCGQALGGSGAGLLGRHAAVLEAVQLLQVAFDALTAVSNHSAGAPQLTLRSCPNSSPACQRAEPHLPHEAANASSSGVCQLPDASLPAARTAASVLVQLSGAKLVLARLQLQQGQGGRAAAEPDFPRVEGRNPQAVIIYLSAAAASSQTGLEPAADYLQQALQHAQEAAEAAAAEGQPSVHAAALLALGNAHMLQAHAALLEEDQQQGGAATCLALCSKSGSSGNDGGGSCSDTAWFDAAWTPWPGQLACSSGGGSSGGGSIPSPAAAAHPADPSSGPACEPAAAAPGDGPAAPPAAPGSAADVASTDADAATAASLAVGSNLQSETALPDHSRSSNSSSSSRPPDVQLPLAAQQPLQQAVQVLQQALEAALHQQQLPTAEAAARALARCFGQLQPEQAAFYLAVAQSCSSAAQMRGSFEQAAAPQHAEVLLWRQMQQLEQVAVPGAASMHQLQVEQLLALLGITSKRLQVPHPAVLKPLLSQLQRNQRLLLLHHEQDRQQLVLAAWGVPGAQLSADAQTALAAAALAASEAAAAAAAAAASTPGAGAAAKGASASGGSPSARGRKSAVAVAANDPAADATAAAMAAVPPAAILGSMPCTQQQLQHLADAFAANSRQLQKAIVAASSQPAPTQPADTSAVPPAVAAAAASGVKKPAAAASKAAGKDKGARDGSAAADVYPPWVPPAPVFPPELNEQWQQLMQQFEGLLQPLSAALQQALQPQTPPTQASAAQPVGKQAKGTSTSGGKASTAAAAAASTQPQPVPTSLQLLLDPALCELPWEALPVVKASCGSIARCLSLAQLQQLLVPPQALLGSSQQQQQQQGSDAAAAAAAATAAEVGQPVVWDVSRASYLVDPMHHMSAMSERPGPYAAPLLQTFRQQVLEAWGQEWQGCAGVDGQVPGKEQLLRPLVGSKGLLVLAPGRLLGHVGSQAVAGLDLTGCTAALLLDHLDNPAAAAHQVKADNRKTDAERAVQGPAQAALLLMLRGVRSVAVAALPGTPHTHVHLAANILRAVTSTQAVQPLQVPPGSNAAAAAAGSTGHDSVLLGSGSGPMSVGAAVVAAQRQGLAGFELQAVREAAVVVYGLAGVVAAADGGGGAGGSRAKAKKG